MGERYARARPNVHPGIVRAISREIAAHTGKVERALDLGCGTGLSTLALRSLAPRVLGLDPSRAMLGAARSAPAVCYLRGRAEAIPLAAASVDLIAIGCAYHWCDRARLLDEAARVLGTGGWLAIYDSGLVGAERPQLMRWLRDEYWSRLPSFLRNPYFDPGAHDHPALRVHATLALEEHVPMTLAALVEFITTQSSTVHAVESGAASLAELEARLRSGLEPHFAGDPELRMRFANPVWLLRRTPGPAR